MSGYKTSVVNDDPISFWTFDLDTILLHGNSIIDEIGNKNPLTINGTAYLLERMSLNDIEVNEQYAITIALEQKYDDNWSALFLEAPHTTDYSFGDNAFSIEFLYYKDNVDIIRDSGQVGYLKTIESPLIQKGTMIQLRLQDKWGGSDNIQLNMFDGDLSIIRNESELVHVWERVNHCVVTYSVLQIDLNEYSVAARLYVNGILLGTDTKNYYDAPPNINVASPWRLAGTGGSDPLVDFQTERLDLDQIAIYDYAMTSEQVSNHYRKTQTFLNLIQYDNPTHFWRMDDLYNTFPLMKAAIGVDGFYYGSVTRGNDGPDNIIDSRSSYFFNNGSASVTSYNSFSNPYRFIAIESNYTIEFWFKSGYGHRGSLFSCHEENPEWKGINIWINSEDDRETVGSIQVNESADRTFNTRSYNSVNYADNKWHHLAVRRSGEFLALYIDNSQIVNEHLVPLSANNDPSQIHMMGAAPGAINVNGFLSNVAIYDYALQELQLNNHYNFTTRYKIFGYTLLEGQPVPAIVRFYDTLTGNKVGELESDSNTGEYTFYTFSDRNLDLMALLPNNNTTRYRVHGPIKPAEYTDSHL